LYDTAVIIVRWYGGVKLGTGGLSRAYRDTAAEALRAGSIEDRYVYERMRVAVPFDQLGVVYRLIDAPHVLLAAEHFGETNEFDFDVRLSRVEAFAKTLVEKRIELLTRSLR
jgi:putative IMPACT (imprinted ancient) family translation regulator